MTLQAFTCLSAFTKGTIDTVFCIVPVKRRADRFRISKEWNMQAYSCCEQNVLLSKFATKWVVRTVSGLRCALRCQWEITRFVGRFRGASAVEFLLCKVCYAYFFNIYFIISINKISFDESLERFIYYMYYPFFRRRVIVLFWRHNNAYSQCIFVNKV